MIAPLAALNFSDPVMLVGLLAAGIPVALHLLNKVRSPIVQFPTLRFLRITAQKTSRKRQLQHWLLLLLRMAVFALIAMGIAGPLVRGGSPLVAYGFVVLFLAGAGLLVLTAVLANAAANKAVTAEATSGLETQAPKAKRLNSAQYWLFSLLTLLAGLFAAGYASFGLGSDKYFAAGTGPYNGRATACVIILDNSYSMLARQDGLTRVQKAVSETKQLITETIHPAEFAVLVTNPGPSEGGVPTADHLSTDPTSTLAFLDNLQTVGKAQPMKALLKKAQDLLDSSTQPTKKIILVSDMTRSSFAEADVLTPLDDKQTQLVLMPISKSAAPADVGISGFALESGQPVVGNEMIFNVQAVNNGDGAQVCDLQLKMDDQLVPAVSARVQLGVAGSATGKAATKLNYRLPAAGSHVFTVAIKDAGSDAIAWDDSRDLVLKVADQIHVVVVGPDEKPAARSSAFFVMAALSPFSNVPVGPGSAAAWSIVPVYESAAQVERDGLSASAVFLCDLPSVSSALADRLHDYASAGGRVCFILGSAVDPTTYNQELAGKRNLLPGTLAAPVVSASGSTVDWVETNADISDVFTGLFDGTDPYRSIVITGRWALPGNAQERGHVLAKLADGSILLTEHPLNSGDIFTLLSGVSGTWSNFATTVPFLPTLVRIALGNAGQMKHSTTGEPGDTIELPLPQDARGLVAEVTAPGGGAPVNIAAPAKGTPVWQVGGDLTLQTGTYAWQTTDRKLAGKFVINPPAVEAELFPADVDTLGKQTKAKIPAVIAYSPEELSGMLAKQSEGVSLAPGVIAIVLMMAVLEALLANRYKPMVKEKATAEEPEEAPAPRKRAAVKAA